MEELISLYDKNKLKIERFIEESLSNIELEKLIYKNSFKKLFSTFSSLELVYVVNNKSEKQISHNYYRYKTKKLLIDEDRSYLLKKLDLNKKQIGFSPVYISSATKNTCITVTFKYKNKILFLDFILEALLEKLNIIELNKPFHTITKCYYFISGCSLALFSVFIVFYSLYGFFNEFIYKDNFTLELIFKPIISLTLGLAIFDLAKTILEQEVFFKSYSRNSKTEIKMFTKFILTIIIALSVEALMVVFKIALNDYTQMINALYLISGVSLIILSLSVFIYLVNKKEIKTV